LYRWYLKCNQKQLARGEFISRMNHQGRAAGSQKKKSMDCLERLKNTHNCSRPRKHLRLNGCPEVYTKHLPVAVLFVQESIH
ncbi:MAG TPA: hypothetical protein VF610_07075, partial [Segetibacter sp.]